MHAYLCSAGFSDIHSVRDVNRLIADTVNHYDEKQLFESNDGRMMAEITRYFGDGFGLRVCGEYDEKNVFYAEYIFPFLIGERLSSVEEIMIERQVANDSYLLAVDDLRIGATLICYLQNMADYRIRAARGELPQGRMRVYLSAFSREGTVLLPMQRVQEQTADAENAAAERDSLMRAAMDGDEEAIEKVTIEDFDTYSMLMERVGKEDVLTIVDTYFMPDGSECDCYSVLGNIIHCEPMENSVTHEPLWKLVIECNKIPLTHMIHEEDLLGETAEGRRFKGRIWLQGTVEFD